MNITYKFIVQCLFCWGGVMAGTALAGSAKVLRWSKVATYPHDPEAFTQGLVYWEPGILAESTGGYGGESTLRRVDLKTGKVLTQTKLGTEFFGEGLAKVHDHFVQLTYREGVAFTWKWSNAKGFQKVSQLTYSGEGWGLANSHREASPALFMSNGSSQITELEPKTFKKVRTIDVNANGKPQTDLNELEVVGTKILANQWRSSIILVIDSRTGETEGIMDIHSLIPPSLKNLSFDRRSEAVANGIAWDPKKKVLYVTGKLWPELFALKVEGL